MTTINSAEILSVGTELLLGEIVDTNSAYLAAELAERGVNVYWSQRVGDNMARIQEGIRLALARSDLLILSGGLGPTDDDMTREAIAAVLGEEPEVDAGLEHTLREKFARFSREMPERNLKQAWLIPSAQTLANPVGTAPGWFVETLVSGKPRVLVTLPGPPRELGRMWTQEVLPLLSLPQSSLFKRTFKTFGMGESGVADVLGERTLQANPSVATYAKKDGVHVRVAAKADSEAQASALAQPLVQEVEELLKDYVWGYDYDEVAQLVLSRLESNRLTLSTAESLTAGLLSSELSTTDSPGGATTTSSTTYTSYLGGVLAYNMQALSALRSFSTLDEPFKVSLEGAADLAQAVQKMFRTDLGLAVHGAWQAGQEASSQDVYIALYDGDTSHTRSFSWPRLAHGWLRERALYASLNVLYTHLKRLT